MIRIRTKKKRAFSAGLTWGPNVSEHAGTVIGAATRWRLPIEHPAVQPQISDGLPRNPVGNWTALSNLRNVTSMTALSITLNVFLLIKLSFFDPHLAIPSHR